ncbi:MAG TPA: OmpA family protein, partial [Paracoccus sp. (in: a-proteobacteria)]|uniref:OmpA family protein n=1 Tax=Paracoccus sp. TaxID=267 RepID=UPI002CFE101D
ATAPVEQAEPQPEPAEGATQQVQEGTKAPAPKAAPADDGLADALAKEADKAAAPAPAEKPEGAGATTPPAAAPAPMTQENAGQAGGEAAPQSEPATDADALAKALAEKNGETAATPEEPAPAATAPQAGQPAQPVAEAPAPEQGAKETEAAKEAAAAEEVAPVAALSEEGGGEVTEEQVTEDNSRSSAEDFATDLRNAMTAATGQPREAARDKDDDKSDLAKALLFGLGGVAVGSMLNNNRQVTLSTPDRVVVTRDDGSQQVIKDEVALLRQPGSTVATENYADGSSRTIVTRADGSKIVTIRDADLRVLRRNLVSADGTTVQLIDDTVRVDPVDIASLPAPAAGTRITPGQTNEEELRAALFRESDAGRRFTLSQIRNIAQVRALAAPVNIDAITFETGSAAIQPDQAEQLSALGKIIRSAVAENPREVFLVEGHTDTVGSDAANLALSDRRAESVALALTEYFEVPPENMVVQGYGEQFPKVRQEGDVRENRRAAIRRITDLLPQSAQ